MLMSDANKRDDNPTPSSGEDSQQEVSYVGEDAKAQELEEEELYTEDSDTPDEEEEVEEESDEQVPFHEHPRFKELISTNKELKEKLEQLESKPQPVDTSKMTAEQRAIHRLRNEYGFATKDDLTKVERENKVLKEQIKFGKFLDSHPEAKGHAEAIQALAYTPAYKSKSYEEIYSEVFKGASPSRKVVTRKKRSGLKPTSSPSSKQPSSSKYISRARIAKMSKEEFKKHEPAIMKAMKEGRIK